MSSQSSAQVTIVKIGLIEFEGLMLDDYTFAIAVPQLASLFTYFQDDQNQAAKRLKRLMGKDFKTTKCKTPFNRNTTLCVTTDDFLKVIRKLGVEKKEQDAIELLSELAGLSIQQLFCDAFKIKFEEEARQEFLKVRQAGKLNRHEFTDAIKDYITRNQSNLSPNDVKFLYPNSTDAGYKCLFGRSARNLKVSWHVNEPREGMHPDELQDLAFLESYAAKLVSNHNLHPVTAIRQAYTTLMLPMYNR